MGKKDRDINSDIGSILGSMSDSIDREKRTLYEIIIEKSSFSPKGDDLRDMELFYFSYEYEWNNFLEMLIKTEIHDSREVVFLFSNYRFIDNHISKIIESAEGASCSADKARAILNGIRDFYIHGREIFFNPDAEYTFHHPEKVFTTHDEIITYFKALYDLYHGHYKPYLLAMQKILEQTNG
jgi:hypothetical protein